MTYFDYNTYDYVYHFRLKINETMHIEYEDINIHHVDYDFKIIKDLQEHELHNVKVYENDNLLENIEMIHTLKYHKNEDIVKEYYKEIEYQKYMNSSDEIDYCTCDFPKITSILIHYLELTHTTKKVKQ